MSKKNGENGFWSLVLILAAVALLVAMAAGSTVGREIIDWLLELLGLRGR